MKTGGLKAGRTEDPVRKAKVTDVHREEARRLKALWDAKPGRGTQAEFGFKFSIGNQSAVGQFLRGAVPLSLKAARAFALGLGCRIADFSPRLAKEAEGLQEVAPAPKAGLSLVDLNKLEAQLVLFYRGMKPERQAEMLQVANNFYAEANPGPSDANPFPNAVPVSKKEKETS